MMTEPVRAPYRFGPTQTILDPCGSHPEEREHQCMAAHYKCVYCGDALKPYNCHGCGRWLTPTEMNEGDTRCVDCR